MSETRAFIFTQYSLLSRHTSLNLLYSVNEPHGRGGLPLIHPDHHCNPFLHDVAPFLFEVRREFRI